VVIADDRTEWQKAEDKWAVCWIHCPLFKNCSSRFGSDCKRLGGEEIPKVGVRNGKQSKAKTKVKKGI
jgi:hypothetical protein